MSVNPAMQEKMTLNDLSLRQRATSLQKQTVFGTELFVAAPEGLLVEASGGTWTDPGGGGGDGGAANMHHE
ncbi:hypothetical protein [Oenococcus oeni]|uniref:hypothetical protein n=1 Tax=Oenococcus oeni TaxID=1247 RepID=UPI00050F2A1A|nr:hypothetical protein [Oenococcus oeni]KGI01505.1 hypothetical protein X293_06625 [Oenococcus oeni IOEB_C52]KMQ38782.1 hypothetical protein AAX19_03240 [Oenococcus oeni]